jgi:hypothetical protein
MRRAIPGFEGLYEAGIDGTIYRLARSIEKFCGPTKTQVQLPEIQLRPFAQSNGYVQVSLFRDGSSCKQYVHRVIALTFIPNPNELPEVNHKDGDKLNNAVTNLEWVTRSDNEKHAVAVLGKNTGERCHSAKLTDADALEVIQSKESAVALAERFGVHFTTIYRVRRGDRWKHLHG